MTDEHLIRMRANPGEPRGGIMLTFGVKPIGAPHEVFVQWKNVEMCADFACPCGAGGHIDAHCFGRWRCPNCGRAWSMSWTLNAYPVEPEESDHFMDVDTDDA